MFDLLSKLGENEGKDIIEPREIFMSLPQKGNEYEYPRDVQSEVWKEWFENRDRKNNIIKMNTGSGKTVVGLIILQSCLNEDKGPAMYVVPDNYLVEQVVEEAKKLGIIVTKEKDDYRYTEKKAILVTNIYSLVNGQSVFGMRQEGNYPIGSIVIDDVHSCMDVIRSKFAIRVSSVHSLYNEIINLFREDMLKYDARSFSDTVELNQPGSDFLIPFWVWQDKVNEVHCLISKYNNDDENNKDIYFNYPLVRDDLLLSSCIVKSDCMEITPPGISIEKIRSLESAARRIYMSATLADDSMFISAFGMDEHDVENIISPKYANDIGDRMILFPQHLNPEIRDEEIKEQIELLSMNYNVVVITPSYNRARFWDPSESRIAYSDSINTKILSLKQGKHTGLVVVVNRYDGIDLPNDACRILVIDGLPPFSREYDGYVQSITPSNKTIIREYVQKIEQGMGRGVRSNNDYCCVVLMGKKLNSAMFLNDGISFFSSATKAQYELSRNLWDALMQETDVPSVSEIFEVSEYILKQNPEWKRRSRERLYSIEYNSSSNIDPFVLATRKAYVFGKANKWKDAADVLEAAKDREKDEKVKAYIMQAKATYVNIYDRVEAQQTQRAAKSQNSSVLSPIEGIQYRKSINSLSQAKSIIEYIREDKIQPNDLIIFVNDVVSDLSFETNSNCFEAAMEKLGKLLGFASSRPDKETGKGPDNLWVIDQNTYILYECKNRAVSEEISKNYCNQLGGEINWFYDMYGSMNSMTPVMVYKHNKVSNLASPPDKMRVMTEELLRKLSGKITEFYKGVVQNANWEDEQRIQNLLQSYGLDKNSIVEEYTESYDRG